MNKLSLFDDPAIRGSLLPFTFTRPVADLRVGILKIAEKWEMISGAEVSHWTQDYLQKKFPRTSGSSMAINGSWLPDANSWPIVLSLKEDEALYFGKTLLASQLQVRSFLDLEGLIFQNTTSTNPQILEILIDYLLPEGDFFQTH